MGGSALADDRLAAGELRLLAQQLLDPQQLEAGIIEWEGNWRSLIGVYRYAPTWDNFDQLFGSLRFPRMVQNTLIMALISEVGVLLIRPLR